MNLNSVYGRQSSHILSGYFSPKAKMQSKSSTKGNPILHTSRIQLIVKYRYRQIPTFGRDTIRKFCTNVSEMKKLAGRDFEDLLQVSIVAVCKPEIY
jgi:hypothetical protein